MRWARRSALFSPQPARSAPRTRSPSAASPEAAHLAQKVRVDTPGREVPQAHHLAGYRGASIRSCVANPTLPDDLRMATPAKPSARYGAMESGGRLRWRPATPPAGHDRLLALASVGCPNLSLLCPARSSRIAGLAHSGSSVALSPKLCAIDGSRRFGRGGMFRIARPMPSPPAASAAVTEEVVRFAIVAMRQVTSRREAGDQDADRYRVRGETETGAAGWTGGGPVVMSGGVRFAPWTNVEVPHASSRASGRRMATPRRPRSGEHGAAPERPWSRSSEGLGVMTPIYPTRSAPRRAAPASAPPCGADFSIFRE